LKNVREKKGKTLTKEGKNGRRKMGNIIRHNIYKRRECSGKKKTLEENPIKAKNIVLTPRSPKKEKKTFLTYTHTVYPPP
jgi:hypothetical protein